MLELNIAKVLVAKENSKLIGFIVMIPNTFKDLYITRKQIGEISAIYVTREYRGRGVASLLLEKALKYLKEQGVELVVTEIHAENVASLSLFEKHNFHVDHTIKFLVKRLK